MVKICFIGDVLTASGLNLVGIKDTHIVTKENIGEIFEKEKNKGIIVIPNTLYQLVKDKVKKLPLTSIVVALPDENGVGEDKAMKMIEEAIGRSITLKK
ncbi:archaeal A1AO-type ATP synthase, subunit F [groundwater metagenome]|uniref:Archaeal A1AO-type ATP synthase, subunit F n=1 Tax=groundwater metagenome TaxID=717931 RepID=A0A098E5Y4_9ZZZZ